MYCMSLKYAIIIFTRIGLRAYVSQILHQYFFHMRSLFLLPDLLYVSQIPNEHIHYNGPMYCMSLKYAIIIFTRIGPRAYVSQILHQYCFNMRSLFLLPDLLYVSQILNQHIH